MSEELPVKVNILHNAKVIGVSLVDDDTLPQVKIEAKVSEPGLSAIGEVPLTDGVGGKTVGTGTVTDGVFTGNVTDPDTIKKLSKPIKAGQFSIATTPSPTGGYTALYQPPTDTQIPTEHMTSNTMFKVYAALRKAGLSQSRSVSVVNELASHGVGFVEL